MKIINKMNKSLTTVGNIKVGNFFKIKKIYYIKFKKASDEILTKSEVQCIKNIEKDAAMIIYDSLNRMERCDMVLVNRNESCEKVDGYIVLNENYNEDNTDGY